jgi:hypothetical protein
MRRIQFSIDETLDAAVTAEAARRGISKAALIRACIARGVGVASAPPEGPWEAMTGWLHDDPVDGIDEVVYGPEGRAATTRRRVKPTAAVTGAG